MLKSRFLQLQTNRLTLFMIIKKISEIMITKYHVFIYILINHRLQINKSSRGNNTFELKIESEYDQEIPQSQTADNPVAPRGRAAQPSQDTRKTN